MTQKKRSVRAQPRTKDAPQRRHYVANAKLRKQITTRLKSVVKELGGVTAFAHSQGIDPKYVYRWTSQGMVPNTDTLIRMAVINNVSPDWLLLGRGSTYINGRRPKTARAA
jgi:hypothetical protein